MMGPFDLINKVYNNIWKWDNPFKHVAYGITVALVLTIVFSITFMFMIPFYFASKYDSVGWGIFGMFGFVIGLFTLVSLSIND